MVKNNPDTGRKVRFILLPILAIAVHYFMSGILLYGFYSFFINVLHITEEQFAGFSGLVEIFINIVLILIFFLVYRWVFKSDMDEMSSISGVRGTAMSLITGAGIPGVSYL